ncbi:MAG: hypothetical protein V1822_01925 [Candidatus Micrarchaeota archaeon]
MQPIILDTNFWLMPYEYRVDLLGGLENMVEYSPFAILVPTPVLNELKMMAGEKGKRAVAAKSAIALMKSLIEKKKAKMVEGENGKADGAIITLALQTGAWVATNDRLLRFRLKEKGIKTVILKDKHAITLA